MQGENSASRSQAGLVPVWGHPSGSPQARAGPGWVPRAGGGTHLVGPGAPGPVLISRDVAPVPAARASRVGPADICVRKQQGREGRRPGRRWTHGVPSVCVRGRQVESGRDGPGPGRYTNRQPKGDTDMLRGGPITHRHTLGWHATTAGEGAVNTTPPLGTRMPLHTHMLWVTRRPATSHTCTTPSAPAVTLAHAHTRLHTR